MTRSGPGNRLRWCGFLLLLALGAPAWADDPVPDARPDAVRVSDGAVIDISGFMERPKGRTDVDWAPPQGLAVRDTIPLGGALQREILTPVDRREVVRRMEVERVLGR